VHDGKCLQQLPALEVEQRGVGVDLPWVAVDERGECVPDEVRDQLRPLHGAGVVELARRETSARERADELVQQAAHRARHRRQRDAAPAAPAHLVGTLPLDRGRQRARDVPDPGASGGHEIQ
jgi:hypothetical protein